MRKVLMLFVDGLGLRPAAAGHNPVHASVCPALCAAFQDQTVAIDAILGIPGLPQSATGQASLLTGVNAQASVGRHVEGFPGPMLRDIVRENNIFSRLMARGAAATFANGYVLRTVEEVRKLRMKSVTTVAALSAFGDVRRYDQLVQHRAVSHDLTRESLAPRGYAGETISIEQAASDLVSIAEQHAFTLFEFFQTDRAGHDCDMTRAVSVLTRLDHFFGAVLAEAAAAGILLVLTSDHGNIEDLRVRTHTSNPVPFLVCGPGAELLRGQVRDLTQVTPAILSYLK